jgi:mycofactocin precursor
VATHIVQNVSPATDSTDEVTVEVLVEDVSIDGMCGVY